MTDAKRDPPTGALHASAGDATGSHSRGDLAPGAMTEYLTDAWGFFIRSARVIE